MKILIKATISFYVFFTLFGIGTVLSNPKASSLCTSDLTDPSIVVKLTGYTGIYLGVWMIQKDNCR